MMGARQSRAHFPARLTVLTQAPSRAFSALSLEKKTTFPFLVLIEKSPILPLNWNHVDGCRCNLKFWWLESLNVGGRDGSILD